VAEEMPQKQTKNSSGRRGIEGQAGHRRSIKEVLSKLKEIAHRLRFLEPHSSASAATICIATDSNDGATASCRGNLES